MGTSLDDMNQFLMLNHGQGSPSGWEEYFSLLHRDGYMMGGSELGEGTAVTNAAAGPAISSTVTGYILIQAPDLETAKIIAEKCPVHRSGGTVEIFPLVRS